MTNLLILYIVKICKIYAFLMFLLKKYFWSNFFLRFLFYQCPSNLEYSWNFGSLASIYLISQFVSGFFLVFWYIPNIEFAFFSIEFIMREVNFGWLFRYLHANGASFFFICIYLHIMRNIFFGSYLYPREKVWVSGVFIFLLVILTAFLGYVLPWGQMSYWAATVISNLVSVFPFVGDFLLIYLWGGLVIEQPTLLRIYGLHFCLPFVIFSLVILHIYFLYEFGSNNPIGILSLDFVPFFPYFFWKDLFGMVFCFIVFFRLVFFIPNYLGHSDNYILADPFVTPLHIVPEWYFLPFYGLLRSIPNKVGGVICLLSAIMFILFFPYLAYSIIRSGYFRPAFVYLYFFFIFNCVILGWCGGKPVDFPFYEMCQVSTFVYFLFFLFLYPIISISEILFFFSFLFFIFNKKAVVRG